MFFLNASWFSICQNLCTGRRTRWLCSRVPFHLVGSLDHVYRDILISIIDVSNGLDFKTREFDRWGRAVSGGFNSVRREHI